MNWAEKNGLDDAIQDSHVQDALRGAFKEHERTHPGTTIDEFNELPIASKILLYGQAASRLPLYVPEYGEWIMGRIRIRNEALRPSDVQEMDWADGGHEVGQRDCVACDPVRGYPKTHTCGGLLHRDLIEEDDDGNYHFESKCDVCGLVERLADEDR